MAIQVTNFTTNWKYEYISPQPFPDTNLHYMTGSYILVSYENHNLPYINIVGKVTNNNDPGAKVLDTIMYYSVEPNTSDLLNFSYNYIINQLTTLNLGVTFIKIS